MINLSDICLDALPSILLENRTQLPPVSCIYFAIDSQGVVQYIGQTTCLLSRWAGHHRAKELKDIGGVKIAYLAVDDPSLLREIESALIEWFRPRLNRTPIRFSSRDVAKGLLRVDRRPAIKKATINHNFLVDRKESKSDMAIALGVRRSTAGNLFKSGCDRMELRTFIGLCEYLGISIEGLEPLLIIERED